MTIGGNMVGNGRPLRRERKIKPLMAELRQIRIDKKWSQTKLADTIGFNLDCVGAWERGEYDPRLLSLVAWCEALGYRLKLEKIDG